MRILSLFALVESELTPEARGAWERRANHHARQGVLWNPALGLSLQVEECELGQGRHSVAARWIDAGGRSLAQATFYCHTPADWRATAAAISRDCPDPARLDPGSTRPALPPTQPLRSPDSSLQRAVG